MMMKYRSLRWLVLASLCAGTAYAGPKQEAKKHIDRATKAHAAGQFEVALSELEAAYELDPQPDLLYALGQIYSKLGRCTDATTEFQLFRAAKPSDPQIAKLVDDAIAACHPAEPEPAKGDKAAATTTGPAAVPTRVVEPKPDTTAPRPAEPTRPEPVAPPPEPRPAAAEPRPRTVAGAEPRAWYSDVLGDALVAGGVVVVIGAGFEYKAARSSLDDAENATTLASYNSLVDDAHGKRTISVVLGIGGAALIGAGIVRYVTHGGGKETRGVALVPTSGGGLVTWGGSL